VRTSAVTPYLHHCTDSLNPLPIVLQLRRWEEEGGMPVLVGGGSFVSRPMSGGYRHPDIFKCAVRPFCLPSLAPLSLRRFRWTPFARLITLRRR